MYKTKTRQIEILVTRSAKNFNLARKEVYKFIKRPASGYRKLKIGRDRHAYAKMMTCFALRLPDDVLRE